MSREWIRRHRLLAVGVLLATAVVTVAAVVHGFDAGHQVRDPAPERAVSTPGTRSGPDAGSRSAASAAGSGTRADAVSFARQAAAVLFTWDTTTDTSASVTTALLEIADPSGEQTPGLLADLPAWLPDEAWWQRLRGYETRQRFDEVAIEVPDTWTRATSDQRTPNLARGTVAVTVTGVRHRHGVVAGEPVSTTHEVSMTMFIVCPPNNDGGCWLARLGAPGKVLE